MKKPHTPGDLAFLGGPPAFEEPLHVGRPNVGNRAGFLRRVEAILDSRWFTNNGPMVQAFEQAIAAYLGVKHCVATCNGTAALQNAIGALDLTGEVIVPSFTFVATAHALQAQGITPVFADIAADGYTLDPASVERMITPRTSAIMGVHVWGHPCDVASLQAICERHGLTLLFDAAHAFGCSHGGTMIGNFGACEILSFHATKFFNTFEGGAVVTNDDALAGRLRLSRNFGFTGADHVVQLGVNAKMTEICAAMGLSGLEAIEEIIDVNRRNHTAYSECFADIPGLRIRPFPTCERSNYQYVVAEIDDAFPFGRDDLMRLLHAENVRARRYFYPGCHRLEPYRSLFPEAGAVLPNTVEVCDRVLSLPTGSAVGANEIGQIAELVGFIAKNADAIRNASSRFSVRTVDTPAIKALAHARVSTRRTSTPTVAPGETSSPFAPGSPPAPR
jgi:dTDP-4-amino-4,6-dideoxygalactose transaminase